MNEEKLYAPLLSFLKEDVAATKMIAQSAMDIARDNKEGTAVMRAHLEGINEKFDTFQDSMDSLVKMAKDSFVTKAEFEPVKKIVFSAVGVILIEFLGMLIFIVWKQ